MGACASKPKVLKEEGIDAPVTREIEPTETKPIVDDAGDTTAPEEVIIEVGAAKEATKTSAAAGGDGDEGESSRRSLEVLLKEAEAKEPATSPAQTKTEHPSAATLAEDKAPVMMETKETEQPAEKVELKTDPVAVRSKIAQPVAERPAAACENPEQVVDKFTVETKTTATLVKESNTVSEVGSKKPVSTATAKIV